MTPRDLFEIELPLRITPELAADANCSFQFNITGPEGGNWYVDFTRASDWIGEGELEGAECTVTAADEDWVKLARGEMRPEMALMLGKVKISGDITLALKLKVLLGA